MIEEGGRSSVSIVDKKLLLGSKDIKPFLWKWYEMTETKNQEMAHLKTPNSNWTNSPSISCQWKGNGQSFYGC